MRSPDVDSPYNWFIAVAAFLLHAATWGLTYSFGIFYVALLKEFPGQESEAAWIVGINMGVVMLMSPLTIHLCRRFNPRVMCCTGILLSSLALHLASKASNMLTLYVTFGVMNGIAINFCYLASLLVLRSNFRKHLDVAFGIAAAGTGAGGVAFGFILPPLIDAHGWRGAFRTLSYTILGFIFCGLVLIPSAPKPEVVHLKSEKKFLKSLLPKKASLKGIRMSIPTPWRNKSFVVLSIAVVLGCFVAPIPYCHIVKYAIEQGIPTSYGERLPLFLAVGSTVGRLSIGKISGWYGVSRITLCQVTLLVLSLTLTLCTLATSVVSLIVFASVFGIFDGAFAVLLSVVVDDIFSDKDMVVQALGNLFAAFCFPYTLGSPFAAWLYITTGSYHTVFLCCGGILFVASCLMSLVRYLLSSSDQTVVDITEKIVVTPESDVESSLRSLIPTNLASVNSNRLLSARVCSLLDLSVELYSRPAHTNSDCRSCECSKDYQVFFSRSYPFGFPQEGNHSRGDCEWQMTARCLQNDTQYTDITDQISGATKRGKNIDSLFCEKQKDFPDVDENRLDDVINDLRVPPPKDHVFDTGSLDEMDDCLARGVSMDDLGYVSATATANFEDSDTQWSLTDTDSAYSSLDYSVNNIEEIMEDKNVLGPEQAKNICLDLGYMTCTV